MLTSETNRVVDPFFAAPHTPRIRCSRTSGERGYHSVEIGTSGLYAQFVPYEFAGQTVNPRYVNSYTDLGVDWQYQYNGVNTIFSGSSARASTKRKRTTLTRFGRTLVTQRITWIRRC